MQLSQLEFMLQKVMVKLIGKSEPVPKLLLPKRLSSPLAVTVLQRLNERVDPMAFIVRHCEFDVEHSWLWAGIACITWWFLMSWYICCHSQWLFMMTNMVTFEIEKWAEGEDSSFLLLVFLLRWEGAFVDSIGCWWPPTPSSSIPRVTFSSSPGIVDHHHRWSPLLHLNHPCTWMIMQPTHRPCPPDQPSPWVQRTFRKGIVAKPTARGLRRPTSHRSLCWKQTFTAAH